jgi:tripartite-type tricarboxylate transporter receptor subunit TctC
MTAKPLIALVVLVLSFLNVTAHASYPDRPIKLLVPFGAGGITDQVARVIATELSQELGQSVVIENRPGAGGNIAAGALVQSPADGYTLMFSTLGLLTVNPHVYAKVPFDPFKSFSYLSTIASTPNAIVVRSGLRVTSLEELVQEAKKKSESVSFGTAGVGSSPHQSLEILQRATGIKVLHVPFKSGAESVNALLAGDVDMTFEALPVVIPHVKSGKLRMLAIASKQRQSSDPAIPTTAEAGFPNVISGSVNGIVAPAGLPAEVQNKLKRSIAAVLARNDVKVRLGAQGSVVLEPATNDFDALVRSENERWAAIMKSVPKTQ